MSETKQEINLLAPEQYNITEELEKYSHDTTRQANYWIDADGNRRIISYKELVESMNRYANALTSLNVKYGDRVLVYCTSFT